jgi:hypothetical protein
MNVFGIKFNGEEMKINKIPNDQLCQAYDPMMINPEKTVNILEDHMTANTSCVAPAYVYLEGTRGKRFLCDYHYASEAIITQQRTPHLWNDIAQCFIEKIETIKETFDKTNNTNVAQNNNCWCGADSYILLTNRINYNILYYCNFHYRKTYYRYLSNGVKFEDIYFITDERNKMAFSINEEIEILKNNFHV